MEFIEKYIAELIALIGMAITSLGGYMIAKKNNRSSGEHWVVSSSRSLVDIALDEAERVKKEMKDLRARAIQLESSLKQLEKDYNEVIRQLKEEKALNESLRKENERLKKVIKGS